jgi:flagellar basal body-associated protein FliL
MFMRRAVLAAFVAALVAAPAYAQPSGGGDATREQQRLTSADSYVPLPTFSTAVVTMGRARGTLVVDVGLDTPDAALRARAQSLQPRLVDALRSALSTYASTYYRDRTAPDPDTLARLMQNAVNRTLGQNGARLLLSNLIYQHRPGA